MLSDADRSRLHQLVFQHLGVHPSVPSIVALLDARLAAQVPQFPHPFQISVWVVERVLLAPNERMFCALVEAVDPGGTVPPLHALVDALRGGRASWTRRREDPLVVFDDRPFVDRDSVRRELAELFLPDARMGCLVIDGRSGEGKSYLLGWCSKLVALHPSHSLASFQCFDSFAADLHPGLLATKLATDLGAPLRRLPRRHEDDQRWALDLATWIARHIVARELVSVLVLDGLHHPKVPAPVHAFVHALLRARASDPALAAYMRVVLLGYDSGLLERQGIIHERHVLEHVDRRMIRDWFERRYPGRPHYDYEDAADFVCESIPEEGPARMHALCTMICAVGRELEGP